ncbi:MAG: type I-E CRISPR-associated protein Cas6/Cse3/CasE [Gammaproteobacteria bacterium]|nr:type I-E CRISPR-associated protein Cas6/Cse3/CasE [Gammaproteobacteria bacterium]
MTLHLSRIPITGDRLRYQLSSDVYAAHRFVMRHFPVANKDPRSELGILWRFEEHNRPHFLVQSLVLPTTEVESKTFDPIVLVEDMTVRFLLVANPSRKQKREGRPNSARIGIHNEETQIAWLKSRLANSLEWADPGAVRVSEPRRLHGRRGTQRVVIDAVTFDGVGHVVDATRLAGVIARGVGPGKAFGCGLLSVSRV